MCGRYIQRLYSAVCIILTLIFFYFHPMCNRNEFLRLFVLRLYTKKNYPVIRSSTKVGYVSV